METNEIQALILVVAIIGIWIHYILRVKRILNRSGFNFNSKIIDLEQKKQIEKEIKKANPYYHIILLIAFVIMIMVGRLNSLS